MRSFIRAVALPIVAGILLSGCALGRSVIDINAPDVAAALVNNFGRH